VAVLLEPHLALLEQLEVIQFLIVKLRVVAVVEQIMAKQVLLVVLVVAEVVMAQTLEVQE
tara:strand:- start:312 stop:491 length:180 start_codon:yes stop_codon:yes gene_type:complete